MKMSNEDQLLDMQFRMQVLKEIQDPENIERKRQARKRTEMFKDKTGMYVLEQLQRELDPETVEEMRTRVSNISILKKIINKKARVYKNGVSRQSDINQDQIDAAVDTLDLNQKYKKSNRYLELHKNTAIYSFPYPDPIDPSKWRIAVRVLDPTMYDVLEDSVNPEVARAYVYGYFVDSNVIHSAQPDQTRNVAKLESMSTGNNKDEIIADNPRDEYKDNIRFVWWSAKYHFTTDGHGEIITTELNDDIADIKNPISPIIPIFGLSRSRRSLLGTGRR